MIMFAYILPLKYSYSLLDIYKVQHLVSLRVALHRMHCSGAGRLIADCRLEDEIWDCRSRTLRRPVQDGGEGGLSLAR